MEDGTKNGLRKQKRKYMKEVKEMYRKESKMKKQI